MSTPLLFQPISFRSVTAKNRIVVAPMCQYSATDGLGSDYPQLDSELFCNAAISRASPSPLSPLPSPL